MPCFDSEAFIEPHSGHMSLSSFVPTSLFVPSSCSSTGCNHHSSHQLHSFLPPCNVSARPVCQIPIFPVKLSSCFSSSEKPSCILPSFPILCVFTAALLPESLSTESLVPQILIKHLLYLLRIVVM